MNSNKVKPFFTLYYLAMIATKRYIMLSRKHFEGGS